MPADRIVSDYHEAMTVLADRTMKQALYDEGAVVMEGVLLTLHGDEHRRRRVLEFSVFKKDFFAYYEREVFPPALAQVLAGSAATGRMDLVDFGYRVTMNLTADFAGVDRVAKTPEETELLLKLVKKFSEGATLVHSKLDKEKVRAEVRAALVTLRDAFVAPSIARREALLARRRAGEITDADLPRDVLTLMLRDREKLGLGDDVILREMAFYLQAGSHSTANSMIHALHELFTRWQADPQDRARVLTDPLYLQRCVHESFRLHPASPVAWRRPEGGCPVDHGQASGGQASAGAGIVIVDMAKANRQRDIFGADADDFNPGRSLPSDVPRWGLTFGYGLHMCLGRDLDGGLPQTADTDPAMHQYGIVTRLIRTLLDRNLRPDPANPPTPDTSTQRPNFGSYPVLID